MKYLALWRPESGEEGAPPSPEHMQEMGALTHEMMAKGSLIGTEPLAPRASGARVRNAGGTMTVSSEEVRMAGYAFLNANSREEAIELAKTFLGVAGDGVCEVRQVVEMPPR